MGYGIKYSTSNVSNTLRRGNVVTTAAHNANPSENFHAGIPIEEGKHTIVKVHSTNDPDFYSLTDTEFIEFVTSLGANIYGVIGAKNYIQSQNDLFYLNNAVRSNIVTDGLVLDLNSKVNAGFVNNKPTTNLVSNPSMIPTTPTSFYESLATYDSNVGGSGWGWSYYPNSNISDDGGMIWNPEYEDPYGQPGVWIMKKRPGGNSESNWAGSAPGAIDSTKDHVVSVWCKTDQASCFRIHINVTQNGSSYWGYGSSFHTGGGEWERLSVVVPKDSGNTSINVIRCQALYTNITADAQWKYYQVEEGSTPTDWVDGSRSQNTTWYDLSGNGNNATLVNGVTFNSDSKSLVFDGSDDYGAVNSVTSDLASSDFTFEALIKGGTQDHKSIFSLNNSGGGNRTLWMVRNAGMGLYDGGTWYIGSIDVDNDEWHHVVATYNKTTKALKTYTDGVKDLDTTTNNTITILSNDQASIAMEYDGATPTDLFNGDIAKVRAYDKVLSETEVLQNYYGGSIVTNNLQLFVDAGNLVSYENGSTTTYDIVSGDEGDGYGSSDSNGTLTNGVLFDEMNGGTWDFDGTDDYITFGSSAFQYQYDDAFSLEVWINPDAVSGFKHLIGITYASYRLALSGNKISFRLDSNNLTTNSGNVVAGEWTHIVATWDPSSLTAKVYQDGELAQSVTDETVNWTSQGTNFQIGNSPGESYYFNGKIAMGKVYNKTLTSDEVQQNYIAHKARFSS